MKREDLILIKINTLDQINYIMLHHCGNSIYFWTLCRKHRSMELAERLICGLVGENKKSIRWKIKNQ